MESHKEKSVAGKIIAQLEHIELSGTALAVTEKLLADPEIHAMQEYANTVAIVRLGFNDHGPVHMRKAARNAIELFRLLRVAGVVTSLEREKIGNHEDSLAAVILAAFMHDLGMSVCRENHEIYSALLAKTPMDRILNEVFPEDIKKRAMIRSLALEGIVGHMATCAIHSIEAGIVLVADGCDMESGRARIPLEINKRPKVGDIHKYSANSIERVRIVKGQEKPVRIEVKMSADVGLFQIEEVLMPKIAKSPIGRFIELIAQVCDAPPKSYLLD